MQLVDEQEYLDWKNKNDDPYGAATFEFAEAWAEEIEQALKNGLELESVAKGCSRKAGENIGVTGFMYGCAVSILAQCWVYGEELRRWHNLDTQLQDEGEKANESGGVLNPALLNIGEGK